MIRPHPHQFARVEFARGGSIVAGAARHPWFWIILIQHEHPYHVSERFDTFAEAVADAAANAPALVARIEAQLAESYQGPPLDVRNPPPAPPACP